MSFERLWRSSFGVSLSASGNSMLSSAVSHGNRLDSWNTTPTRAGSGSGIGRPARPTVPTLWRRRPASIMRSEVLPQPLGPTSTTNLPAPTVSEMSSSAGTLPSRPS